MKRFMTFALFSTLAVAQPIIAPDHHTFSSSPGAKIAQDSPSDPTPCNPLIQYCPKQN